MVQGAFGNPYPNASSASFMFDGAKLDDPVFELLL